MNLQELNTVVNKCRPRLVSYLHDHLKDRELSADFVHDVFLKAVEALNEGKSIANLESYLFIMVRNKLIDYWRKASVDRELRETYWQRIQDDISMEPIAGIEIDLAFLRNEISKSLTHQQRIIFELHSQSGLSVDEIASQLSITKSTAKQHLILARKKVKEYVDKYGVYMLGLIFIRL